MTLDKSVAAPDQDQEYPLLEKHKLSHDSYLLEFGIPNREILGIDGDIPTCLKVHMPANTDVYKINKPTSSKALHKSYSPISHPKCKNKFELVVKAYPFRENGGLGAYLCSLQPNVHSIVASLKKARVMHNSTKLYKRWRHVGLIAGGTGIAPLFQIAKMLTSPDDENYTQDISLLYMNKAENDVLLHKEIDALAHQYPHKFRATYSLTVPSAKDCIETKYGLNHSFQFGRGNVDMIRSFLPSPSNDDTMIFVCGRDGFVEYWGGPVTRGPKPPNAKKGPKIQGPLLGLLKEAGFKEHQVFKY